MNRALELTKRLKHEPMSMYRAEMAGNEDFMGWSRLCSIGVAIYHATAAAAKGKKLAKNELYPVPEVKKKKNAAPKSVRDLDWGKMLGGLDGSV